MFRLQQAVGMLPWTVRLTCLCPRRSLSTAGHSSRCPPWLRLGVDWRAFRATPRHPRLRQLSPRQLTDIIKSANDVRSLLKIYAQHHDEFNHIHLGAFWNRLGRHAGKERAWLRSSHEELQLLRDGTLQQLPQLNARALANVAHGIAKVGIGNSAMWSEVWVAISGNAEERLHEFNPQDLANTAWAFAWLDDRESGDVLFGTTSFATCCASKEAEFTPAAKHQLHFWSQWRAELSAPWPALPF